MKTAESSRHLILSSTSVEIRIGATSRCLPQWISNKLTKLQIKVFPLPPPSLDGIISYNGLLLPSLTVFILNSKPYILLLLGYSRSFLCLRGVESIFPICQMLFVYVIPIYCMQQNFDVHYSQTLAKLNYQQFNK